MNEESLFTKYKTKRRIVVGVSILIIAALYAFKNTSFLVTTLSTIGFLILFYIVDHFFDIEFKDRHYGFILIIAVSGFLLSPFYYIYPSYDKVLHFILPLLFADISFHMVDKLDIKLRWKLTFVFFIVIGFVGLHEIGEYTLDWFFDLKLQGVFLRNLQSLEKYDILLDRIDDTMIDMILGVLGAAVYCLGLGWFKQMRKD